MHDPMTVAWEVRAPWFRRDKHFSSGRYHPSLVTIWHVDPEADGSDDSCDWGGRRLGSAAKALAKEMAEWDDRFPYFFVRPSIVANPEYPSLRTISPGDCLALVLEVFQKAAWRLERRSLTNRDVLAAVRVSVDAHDNLQGTFTRKESTEDKCDALRQVLSCFMRYRRPWYKHPRFHLHHWKVQVHAVHKFKRWAFSRCEVCGEGFKYGEAPTITSWGGEGPRWFRGEPHVRHRACAIAALAEDAKNVFA